MKVFLDTNVLVSAFATRGLCADVFRLVLTDPELIIGEVVLDELRRVLSAKIKLPRDIVDGIELLLRDQTVVPKPPRPSPLKLRDRSDRWVLASAVAGRADILVTGDQELLGLGASAPLPLVDPRGFWSRIRK